MNESLATFLTVSITYRKPLNITHKQTTSKGFLLTNFVSHIHIIGKAIFHAANTIFAELLQTLPDLPAYEDFFYQHYGKSKLDEGDFQTALTCFQKALQIRLQKGNEELIHSTKLCIAYCMSRQ